MLKYNQSASPAAGLQRKLLLDTLTYKLVHHSKVFVKRRMWFNDAVMTMDPWALF
jgi:hypothetical protein